MSRFVIKYGARRISWRILSNRKAQWSQIIQSLEKKIIEDMLKSDRSGPLDDLKRDFVPAVK
jgi:hypothetical protein